MKTSIICVGTELNLGQIINTNSQYIAEQITAMGLECNYIFTVRDEIEDIIGIVKNAFKVSDVLIISGGLGPTSDDITREAVARAFELNLLKEDKLDATSTKFLKRIKNKSIQDNLLKQSYIPEGSRPFIPKVGSASGFWLEIKGKNIFSIPGVPKEMKSMFQNDVRPALEKIMEMQEAGPGKVFVKKSTLLTTDISESEIEEKIKDVLLKADKEGVKIGITAMPGIIKIIIIVKSSLPETNDKKIKAYEDEIISKVGTSFYGKESSLLSEVIKPLLISRGHTLSIAESITGGLISSMITDIPGSSEFFRGAVVSYSDYAKEKILHIGKDTIKLKGAVSKDTCIDMVNNVQRLFGSDYSISVTGFAGPDADKSSDVGLVFSAIKCPNGSVKVYDRKFLGTRTEIKFRVVQFVLNKLRLELIESING